MSNDRTTHGDPTPRRGTPDGEKGERISRVSGGTSEPLTPNVEPPRKGEPKDKGYGPSHGYPPGHGGPTSPGDAPAKP